MQDDPVPIQTTARRWPTDYPLRGWPAVNALIFIAALFAASAVMGTILFEVFKNV